MTEQDLLQQVLEWLEAERQRVDTAAKALGLPASLPGMQVVGRVDEHGRIERRTDPVPMSAWASGPIARQIEARVGEGLHPLAAVLAQRLYGTFGDLCEREDFFTAQPFEENPAKWIEQSYLAPLREAYLNRLASLDTNNAGLATQLGAGLLAQLSIDRVYELTWFPVGGFQFDGEYLTSGEVTLRRLRSDELGALGAPLDLSFGTAPLLDLHHQRMAIFRDALEIRVARPKTKQSDPDDDLTERTLLAFQLLGFEPCGAGRALRLLEPGLQRFRLTVPVPLPPFAATKKIDQSLLASVVDLTSRIPAGSLRASTKAKDVVLQRFQQGACRELPHDALIDFVTSLEGLLLPGGGGALGYQFRYHGAWFLGKDQDERAHLLGRLKDVYHTRSSLVHGGDRPSIESITEAYHEARELARRMILKAIRGDWPTRSTFDRITLGGSPS